MVTDCGRREFIKSVASVAVAGGGLSWQAGGASAQTPSAPGNVRVLTEPKSTLGLSDLTWRGVCDAPSADFSYNEAQVALRYVNGERRLLMLKWHNKDATHGTAGNLAELRMPALATDPARSTAMTVVREWTNWCWTPTGGLVDQLANGWLVGGLWWDELQEVLWYTLWPYYAPSVVMPFLGAVRLHDNGTVTRYGPWHYVSNDYIGFRKVCWYFLPIPQQYQPLFGGRRIALGANVLGASGGSPTNWGPGLTALHLPDLASTQAVEAGIPIMDYSPGAGGLAHPWYFCRREADYHSFYDAGALPGTVGSEGFWQSSADMAFPAAWVDSSRRSGLLLIGQRTANDTWYGLAAERNTFDAAGNFLGRVPVNPPDTMAPDQGSTGYHSNGWQSAAWVVPSQHIEEVARGQRKPSADGMRPQLLGQWHQQWTSVPRPLKRPYVHQEGMVVDAITNELIWVHGASKLIGCCVVNPTIHVLSLP